MMNEVKSINRGRGTAGGRVRGKVSRKRLSDQIYDLMREDLRSGQYSLDMVFGELELSESLDTSRTPVREALFRMASNGLLVECAGGYRLPRLSQIDVHSIVDARKLVETTIVRGVAASIDAAGIAALNDALQMEKAAQASGSTADFIYANNQFRRTIFQQASNRYLQEVAELFNDRMQAYRVLSLTDAGNRTIVVAAHQKLVTAIENHSPNQAAEIYLQMLEQMRVAYLNAAQ